MHKDHNTFLLVWNPERWKWNKGQLEESIKLLEIGKIVSDRWSCGNSKRLKIGDRVFLIRLGKEPKGIFASGWVVQGSTKGPHWDREKALIGDTARYVWFNYDVLLNPEDENILARDILKNDPRFSQMHWDAQMSGTQIHEHIALEVEKEWSNLTSIKFGNITLPEEVLENETLFEGALQKISVVKYERNIEARKKCIAYHGTSCSVCDLSFEQKYGKYAKDFIHVHHLKPISTIGHNYEVDPINDLRPVCPNCHAVIHLQKPPLSIEEAKKLLSDN